MPDPSLVLSSAAGNVAVVVVDKSGAQVWAAEAENAKDAAEAAEAAAAASQTAAAGSAAAAAGSATTAAGHATAAAGSATAAAGSATAAAGSATTATEAAADVVEIMTGLGDLATAVNDAETAAAAAAADAATATAAVEVIEAAVAAEATLRIAGDTAIEDHLDEAFVMPELLPATSTVETLIATPDGYPIVTYDHTRNILSLLGLEVDLASVLSDGLEIRTPDGFTLFSVHPSGGGSLLGTATKASDTPLAVVTKNGYEVAAFDIGRAGFAGSDWRPSPNAMTVSTRDGRTSFDVDESGPVDVILGRTRLAVGRPHETVPGGVASGMVWDVVKSGEWWQYMLENERGGCRRVLVHDTGDEHSPHVADTPIVEIDEGRGQSWATLDNYLSVDTLVEDPTGEVKHRLDSYNDPDVVILRRTTANEAQPRPWMRYSKSDGSAVGDFYRFRPSVVYSLPQLACAVKQAHRRRLGLPRRTLVSACWGWPGQTFDKFLPENTTVTAGAASVTAALVTDEAEYLWARDIIARAEIEDIVRGVYGRTPRWGQTTWVQGTAMPDGDDTTPDIYGAFLTAFRAADNGLRLRTLDGTFTRPMIFTQRSSVTNTTLNEIGAMDQLTFAKGNVSGLDFLAGPTAHILKRDNIHFSAFGVVNVAEMIGLCGALVEAYGEYEPLWHTGIVANHNDNTITITTNSPRQASGGLLTDTATVPLAEYYGFNARLSGSSVAMSSVNLSGSSVVMVPSTPLVLGQTLEISHAHRGVSVSAGTTEVPKASGCRGNIKKAGAHQGIFSPGAVDQWLCGFVETVTVT